MRPMILMILCLATTGCAVSGPVAPRNLRTAPYAEWANGFSKDADYFPIAVWLQDPKYARQYKDAGINLYIGLWKGPTEKQLADLKAAGMPVICAQNEVALKHLEDPNIVAWMHGDEPDNAQTIGKGKAWETLEEIEKAWPDMPKKKSLKAWGTYGPPIPPKTIIANYKKIKANDPSRPIVLNLGQGVAYKDYIGRGVRRRKQEDYPEYIKGCDVVSFDIYPVVHSKPAVKGKLEFVPKGVTNLRKWSQDQRIVWNCIECTRISNVNVKPTPAQVRTEVWMSIIHGSRGLIYFVHQFKPTFDGHALLTDPKMLAAVTKINRQVQSLAAVINSPTVKNLATVATDDESAPIALMAKAHDGATYVFAAAMQDKTGLATVTLKGLTGETTVEVIGEGRTLKARDGKFVDRFEGYDVHLYKIK